jgi:methylmalonyl-CoA/ethylmalonyl-CoA epimerase
MAIKLNGVNHFAISVPDLETAAAWYESVLGFTMSYEDGIPQLGVRIGHMAGPGCMLEIFQAKDARALPEDRKMPNTDIMTHGNKHISFGVVDGRAAKAELEAMGVEIVMVAEVNDTYGVFIRDNTGNLIEIFEEGQRGH